MKTMQNLKNLTLEVSLKPFKDTSPEGLEQTARKIFAQWSALIRHADSISIMLWPPTAPRFLIIGANLTIPLTGRATLAAATT